MSKNKHIDETVDYAKIGQAVAAINDTLIDRKRLYRTAFMKGVFSGLGSVIGATIVLALLLWVLSLFNELPFIGTITKTIEETVNSAP